MTCECGHHISDHHHVVRDPDVPARVSGLRFPCNAVGCDCLDWHSKYEAVLG